MKQLEFVQGQTNQGQRLKSGSLAWLQVMHKELFVSVLQMLNGGTAFTANTVYVLYGCNVLSGTPTSGQPVSIAAGAVLYNGEIYFVPAFSSASLVTGVAATLVITSFNDSASGHYDSVTFGNGSTGNVHLDRTIVLIDGNGASPGFITGGLYSTFMEFPDKWHNVGAGGEPAFLSSWANAYNIPLAFRKEGNKVYIKGLITNAGSIDRAIFTMPAAYRPTVDYSVCIPCSSDDTNKAATLFINQDGTVNLFNMQTSSGSVTFGSGLGNGSKVFINGAYFIS